MSLQGATHRLWLFVAELNGENTPDDHATDTQELSHAPVFAELWNGLIPTLRNQADNIEKITEQLRELLI